MIEKMSLIRDQYSFCWRNQSGGAITRVCFKKMKKVFEAHLLSALSNLAFFKLSACVLLNKTKSINRFNLVL